MNKVMKDNIFTKIINGELPCYKIYEDGSTLAFLDLHPIQPGHTLVIPKKQIVQLWDLDDEDYAHLLSIVKKVALRLRDVQGVERIGVQVIGVHVPHAHVQLIPFNTVQEFLSPQDMDGIIDHQNLARLSNRLAIK
jgi:histidine triad (HIT) family protein